MRRETRDPCSLLQAHPSLTFRMSPAGRHRQCPAGRRCYGHVSSRRPAPRLAVLGPHRILRGDRRQYAGEARSWPDRCISCFARRRVPCECRSTGSFNSRGWSASLSRSHPGPLWRDLPVHPSGYDDDNLSIPQVIGSAAGIAYMGLENVSFSWYLNKISPAAVAGYLAGRRPCASSTAPFTHTLSLERAWPSGVIPLNSDG